MVLEGRWTYGATCSNLATGKGLTMKISFKRRKGGSASKRVTSVTFTFMCPWEQARQERETFFDSFPLHSRRTLLIRALPYGGVNLGSRSKGMMQKKERGREGIKESHMCVCFSSLACGQTEVAPRQLDWKPTSEEAEWQFVYDSRPQTALFRDSDRENSSF